MYIAATGMVCSAGLDSRSASAALRAGIAKFDETSYRDNNGEPIVGAVAPIFEGEVRFEERFFTLLTMALEDCLKGVDRRVLEQVPLLVGLPEAGRPGVPDSVSEIIAVAEKRLGVRFDPEHSRTLSIGHTAGFRALGVARELLRNPRVPACLISGVDSYMRATTLLWLEHHDRLKTPENSDGVIPGEAASAVLVTRAPVGGTGVRVAGLGFGQEKSNVLSEEPLLGLGLTEAARGALGEAGVQMHQLDFRLSDVTGEAYGFKEHSLMIARLMRVGREEFPIWHCADSIGDTGAAAGTCELAIGFGAFLQGHSPGNRAVCSTSSVPGDRAVAVLHCETAK